MNGVGHNAAPHGEGQASVNGPPPGAPKKHLKRKSLTERPQSDDDDAEISPLKKNKPQEPLKPFTFGGADFNNQKEQFMMGLSSYTSQPTHDAAAKDEEKESQDNSFDDLLQTFASMEFPDSAREECPICCTKLRVMEFASHVYQCADKLDAMDEAEQERRSEQVAMGLIAGTDVTKNWVAPPGGSDSVRRSKYQGQFEADFRTQCPVCQKELILGTAINQHINECLDASMSDDKQGDAQQTGGMTSARSSQFSGFRDASSEMADDNEKEEEEEYDNMEDSAVTQPLLSSQKQLAACAKLLIKEEKGSEKYGELLNSFKQLGLTKENLQNSLKGGKNGEV